MPSDWAREMTLADLDWRGIEPLPPLRLADGSGLALEQTAVRVACDDDTLFVRFDCDDADIWGTLTERDDPIYDEEVVEVFLAPGEAVPVDYFEFEVSPNGVLFDARIHNPSGDRADMIVDVDWDCPGIRWDTGRDDAAHSWWAVMVFPWRSLADSPVPARVWRANFYRIERPRNGVPEFSCWSPTMTEPADFHKPATFGMLRIADS